MRVLGDFNALTLDPVGPVEPPPGLAQIRAVPYTLRADFPLPLGTTNHGRCAFSFQSPQLPEGQMNLHKVLLRFLVASLVFLALSPIQAQFIQQGGKIIGTGAVGSAYQGGSVALSADGNTAIVGGGVDSSGAGAAWVFTRSSGVWSQQGSKLVGTGAVGDAQQGFSVALSADGNTAIVGGYLDSSSVGATWVFTRSSSVWSQQGGKLIGAGAVGDAWQGSSVALSADGNTAIVGGPYDSSSVGATWVFTRSSGVWSQQGGKLIGAGAVGDAWQGRSVALSADGNTAIVGGSGDSSHAGATWVFTRSSGVWSQQGGKIVGTGAVGEADQGYSVALSADGNTAIVGGYYDSPGAGATWVFTRSSGVWSQQGSKLVGTGAVGFTLQGYSVALSADGNTAIVGGPYDNFDGATWVFTRSSGVWSQQGGKLVGTGAVGVAYQGWSVALSADGNTAIVGGIADSSGAGATWVFTRSETPVREEAVNVPSQFVLEQNYPNPFNPSTKIQFTIVSAQSGSASGGNRQLTIVKVFDVLGREVATLVNEVKEPGTYTVEFNASSLASGVYFYRLQAGTYVETRKLLLLR